MNTLYHCYVVLHCFLSRQHPSLMTTLALLHMFTGEGREHKEKARGWFTTVVHHSTCRKLWQTPKESRRWESTSVYKAMSSSEYDLNRVFGNLENSSFKSCASQFSLLKNWNAISHRQPPRGVFLCRHIVVILAFKHLSEPKSEESHYGLENRAIVAWMHNKTTALNVSHRMNV